MGLVVSGPNFSDGCISPGIKEPLMDSLDSATNVEMVDIKYPEFSGSSKGNDFNAADVSQQLIVKSRDDGQMHDPNILRSERVEDGPLSSSITNLRTEESTFAHSDDCFALSSDSNPRKAEATSDVLLDNKIYAGENVKDCSLTSVAKETNLKGKDEIKSDRDMVEIVVSSHNTVVETCEGGPKIAVRDEVNSDCQVAGGAFNLKEMNNAEFLSEIPQDDLPLEVNSTASTDTSTNGVQGESAHMRQFPTSDVKKLQEWREGNVDMFTLSSCNVGPDVAHPQNEYEDFKDHEGVSSQNSLSLRSSEASKQKRDDLKDSVSEENNFLINQSQLSEKRELLSPDVQVLHGSMKEQANCEVVAEKMHAEESIEISSVKFMVESDKRLDEIGASINAMKTEINESYMVPFSEEINDVAVDGKCRGSSIENDIGISMKTLQTSSNLHLEVKPSSGLYKSDDAVEMDKIEKCDKTDAQSPERPTVKDTSLPKYASSAQEDIKDDEINSNDRVNEECNRFVGTCSDSHQVQDAELLVKAAEELDTQDEEPDREASGITDVPVQDQSGTNEFKLASSEIYTPVDSSSRCDSLEGNWGSVSVSAVSMQSDVQANIDAEGLPSTDLLATTDAGKSNLKDPKAASERQQFEKPEMFEPPSFMTLVEPGHVVGQNTTASEVGNGLNQQHTSSTTSQVGWFPILTQVTNESQGRKRNEEIIAKVTNWSNNKQHTSLKSALAEASHSNKPKSTKLEENSVNQKNGKAPEDNDSGLRTVNSIPGPESPAAQTVKEEGGKEWNSPARYPADIKREKKKAKSRPYWIQFVCCSSVDTQRR
ncbi:uncharacterized protein LOC133285476 [Gastrolobium bilobum]|uniref:uncharacterized protein LOC133285476 n=1 Tax=Gastrolobium bilobum TaxID=150636 RepID=UPI002AB32383|nr:uncharacterized protein LOC133285476 [Gastrolobium bilobum]